MARQSQALHPFQSPVSASGVIDISTAGLHVCAVLTQRFRPLLGMERHRPARQRNHYQQQHTRRGAGSRCRSSGGHDRQPPLMCRADHRSIEMLGKQQRRSARERHNDRQHNTRRRRWPSSWCRWCDQRERSDMRSDPRWSGAMLGRQQRWAVGRRHNNAANRTGGSGQLGFGSRVRRSGANACMCAHHWWSGQVLGSEHRRPIGRRHHHRAAHPGRR